MNNKVAIIGGGNLGSAIAQALIAGRFRQPQNIIITKKLLQHLILKIKIL
jgi:pyrroline-5-carboxylate reductase